MTRRDVLKTMGGGFGMMSYAGIAEAAARMESPLSPKAPHFEAKA